MTNYRDGNIYGWNGGECPVNPKDEVGVWFRGAGPTGPTRPGNLCWQHDPSSWGIIAFQGVKKHEEQMTLWVNIYGDGDVVAWETEIGARKASGPDVTRIAVPFREVTE